MNYYIYDANGYYLRTFSVTESANSIFPPISTLSFTAIALPTTIPTGEVAQFDGKVWNLVVDPQIAVAEALAARLAAMTAKQALRASVLAKIKTICDLTDDEISSL